MSVGCTTRLPVSLMPEHSRYCLFREIKCPVKRACPWRGLKGNLPAHIRLRHSARTLSTNVFLSTTTKNENIVTFFRGELFTFSKFFHRTSWYCIVESIGLTQKKYECIIELTGNDEIDYILLTVPIYVKERNFHKFSMKLPGTMMRHFITGGVMNMEVRIRDVTWRTYPS